MGDEIEITGDNQGNPLVRCPVCRAMVTCYVLEYPGGEDAYVSGHDRNGQRCAGSQRQIPGFIL